MDINVLSLNCWGLPFLSKYKNERIDGIIRAVLNIEGISIVCFQEIWSMTDFRIMQNRFAKNLPYSHYFHCGIFGSGLCLFSQFPIIDVLFYQWPLNGYMHKIQHADWFGGKGIGLCQLSIHEFKINVYIAHLHAEYGSTDDYYSHRIHQAYETAKFIKLTSNGCDGVILAGDLNIEKDTLAYKLVTETLQFKDCLIHVNPHSLKLSNGLDKCKISLSEQIVTSNAIDNSFHCNNFVSKRIDYIFCGILCPLSKNNVQIDVIDYKHPLPNRVPGKCFSYSDHEAVFTRLRLRIITDPFDCQDGTVLNPIKLKSILNESRNVLLKGIKDVERFQKIYQICLIPLIFFIICLKFLFFSVLNNYLLFFLYFIEFFLIALFIYTFIMATFWSYYERNALLLTITSIDRDLDSFFFQCST